MSIKPGFLDLLSPHSSEPANVITASCRCHGWWHGGHTAICGTCSMAPWHHRITSTTRTTRTINCTVLRVEISYVAISRNLSHGSVGTLWLRTETERVRERERVKEECFCRISSSALPRSFRRRLLRRRCRPPSPRRPGVNPITKVVICFLKGGKP